MNEVRNVTVRSEKSYNGRVIVILAAMVGCLLLVSALFSRFIYNYKANVVGESAEHLTEINYQIKSYIEEKINTDWKILNSIVNGVNNNAGLDDDGLLSFMDTQRDIWRVSDIAIYTENGRCVSTSGRRSNNDRVSEMIYEARRDGRLMTIVDSIVTYTIPVESELTFKGSRVVAVSVEQELESFIDNMHFSSFDGSAYIYLTQQNGAVISRLSHPYAQDVYNVSTLIEEHTVTFLDKRIGSVDDILTALNPQTLILKHDGNDEYVVSTPLEEGLRLFYFVPEQVVNTYSNQFSEQVTYISLAVIALVCMGGLLVFLSVYRTRKREFDAAIMTRDRMFDLLVNNTSNAFTLLSEERGEALYTSSNLESVTGVKEIVLKKVDGGFRLSAPQGDDGIFEGVNRELALWNGECEFGSDYLPFLSRGLVRYFIFSIYPVENSEHEFIGIAQDVTRIREREEAVKTALAMADSANAAKMRFLANMSHDIRTPMNAIVNMTDFALESTDKPEEIKEYLNTIKVSSDHLLHLINDILDMSHIESGLTLINADRLDMQERLKDVCEIIAPLAEAKKQKFSARFGGIRSNFLMGDELKLTQILVNILNNAVKFTDEGGSITFTVSERPSLRSETAVLRFTIMDTGIGIPADNIEHIFEPFNRVNNKRVRTTEGTGLGLSICSSYVNLMGGSIKCESEEDKGTTFIVELPFTKATVQDMREPEPENLLPVSYGGKRALLCEDNEINMRIAQRILKKLDFEVDGAFDGAEGVEKFTSSEPGTYDIIYMDIQMPIMDGYEATKAIRESAHPQARSIPIVAMTANVFASDVENSRIIGMDGHLGKPIVIKELISETNKVFENRRNTR